MTGFQEGCNFHFPDDLGSSLETRSPSVTEATYDRFQGRHELGILSTQRPTEQPLLHFSTIRIHKIYSRFSRFLRNKFPITYTQKTLERHTSSGKHEKRSRVNGNSANVATEKAGESTPFEGFPSAFIQLIGKTRLLLVRRTARNL